MLNKKEGVNKMKEVKITAKMKLAIQVLKEVNEGKGAFAREVLNYLNENYADRADLQTFNGVNATLAYCVKAGLLNSKKGVYDEKMLTQYFANDNTPDFDEEAPLADQID